MEASANSFPYSSKCMNFLLQQQHFLSPLLAACGLGSLISTIFLDTSGIEPELCFTRILRFRETRVMRRQRKMRRVATRRQRTRMAITAESYAVTLQVFSYWVSANSRWILW
ncbi:hypothetical protein ACFX2I_011873 [Malus domestica]